MLRIQQQVQKNDQVNDVLGVWNITGGYNAEFQNQLLLRCFYMLDAIAAALIVERILLLEVQQRIKYYQAVTWCWSCSYDGGEGNIAGGYNKESSPAKLLLDAGAAAKPPGPPIGDRGVPNWK